MSARPALISLSAGLATGVMVGLVAPPRLLAAAVASLAVVVPALVQPSSQRNATAVASVLLSVLSVALSWALVNTVYAFKYARLYYLDEPDMVTQHPTGLHDLLEPAEIVVEMLGRFLTRVGHIRPKPHTSPGGLVTVVAAFQFHAMSSLATSGERVFLL